MASTDWKITGSRTWRIVAAGAVLLAALSACKKSQTAKIDPELGVAPSPKIVADNQTVPRGGGRFLIGEDYRIANRTYKPKADPNYDRVGVASFYGRAFHGRKTANGEVFDMYALSAAHPTLPIPSYVRVTNLANDRSVVVRVNDRGPFAHGRIIDVSQRAAEVLGFTRHGTAKVRVQYVEVARIDGKDTQYLLASYRGPGTAGPAGKPNSRPNVNAGTLIADLQIKSPARLGEEVPEHIVSSGAEFDPFASIGGRSRHALVQPRPGGALFGVKWLGGQPTKAGYRSSFAPNHTPNPALRAISDSFQ